MGPATASALQPLPAGPAQVLVLCCLQVDSPSCIWSRVSSGPGGQADTVEQYRRLTLQMNLFYRDVQEREELKLSVLEEGQVRSGTTCDCTWAGPDLSFPAGVCGVLAGPAGLVSGHGGGALRGLRVLPGVLPAGGPRGTSGRLR